MTDYSALKNQLHDFCLSYVKQRIETAQNAIAQAQRSANEETKSSAGDKYETGRSMMQIEIGKNSIQLNEASKLKQALLLIRADQSMPTVQPGALVITDFGNYYISIGAGQCILDGKVYITVSPVSPIGIKMAKLVAGDSFEMNGKRITLEFVT